MTPRDYLYCALDLRDRRWIDSLTDERAKELAERVSDLTEQRSRLWFKRPLTVGEVLERFTGATIEASGEYPGWR